MNLKKLLKISKQDLAHILAFKVPHILIYFGLIGLVFFTFNSLFFGKNILHLFLPYLTIVGLEIAFAATSFSYASVCDKEEKKYAVLFGEAFLLSSIFLVMGLVINVMLFAALLQLPRIPQDTIRELLEIVLYLTFGAGTYFAYQAAIYTNIAIEYFESRLYFRIRDNKLIDFKRLYR